MLLDIPERVFRVGAVEQEDPRRAPVRRKRSTSPRARASNGRRGPATTSAATSSPIVAVPGLSVTTADLGIERPLDEGVVGAEIALAAPDGERHLAARLRHAASPAPRSRTRARSRARSASARGSCRRTTGTGPGSTRPPHLVVVLALERQLADVQPPPCSSDLRIRRGILDLVAELAARGQAVLLEGARACSARRRRGAAAGPWRCTP